MHRSLLHLCPFAIGVVYICLKFDPRECKPPTKFLCIHAVQVIFTALYRLYLRPRTGDFYAAVQAIFVSFQSSSA